MIKLFGCFLILLSSIGIGYIYGNRYKNRERELKFLKACFQMLETEITYSCNPLPMAFNNISKKSIFPYDKIFALIYENLQNNKFNTVGEAFKNAIMSNKNICALNSEDVELLCLFGSTLGESDIANQAKSFSIIYKGIDIHIEKSKDERLKYEKLYKNLGLFTGITIIILLL